MNALTHQALFNSGTGCRSPPLPVVHFFNPYTDCLMFMHMPRASPQWVAASKHWMQCVMISHL